MRNIGTCYTLDIADYLLEKVEYFKNRGDQWEGSNTLKLSKFASVSCSMLFETYFGCQKKLGISCNLAYTVYDV